ncbi:MAG: AarF/ABC1/UbiB kinase family protein [Deltaproteobacteria bacterium]|nr:AarF/ABC1/UbiB kinase family protein [Deltaproteobacteria bacterium]
MGDERDEQAAAGGFRQGRVGRFVKIASLATRVSSSYLGQRIKRAFVSAERAARSLDAAHLRNAERVTRALGSLKGAVMKVGQMVSLNPELLPDVYTRLLSGLQKGAPPVRFEVIAGQLEAELGRPLDRVFARLDEQPFASASIGQVHRGRLHDGRDVAVKVQYPGVDRTVESDIRNLRTVLRSAGLLSEKRGWEVLVDEVRDRLAEELDYRNELANMEAFSRLFAGDARLVVPRAHADLTTRRALFMDYVPGKDFSALCERPKPEREAAGHVMMDLYLRQFLVHRTLHADPNPANYAFLPDGRLVLYDYGCVRRYSDVFIRDFARLLRETIAGRHDRLPANLAGIGLVPMDGESFEPEFYAQFATPILEPFATDELYDFGQSRIHEDLLRVGMANWHDGLKLRPPAEVVFLDRVVVGMYNNLRQLGARGNWHRLLLSYLEGL